MNPVTTALTLNMQLPNIAAVSWAVQGDQLSRQIQATLVDGSTAWNPQAGYHGIVRFQKPDGTSGVYDVDEDGNPAVTWTGNVATVKIVQQALTVAGTVLMQLEFYDSNEARVTAFGWVNNVQPSAVTDDEFLSSDYYNILTLQIAGVLGAAGHAPYIDSVTKNWMIWDTNVNDYVDSGVYSIGPPPTPQSTTYEYANSASGTVVPSAWSETRPEPVKGQYSWTKITTTWETGSTVYYTVAYQGADGTSASEIKQIIATEETSTTSAHAYAIGDYFILANVLYVATAAIGIGDTIAAGTNCTQTTVGAEIVSIKNTLSQLETATQKIIPIFPGSTNNLGYTLKVGDYFEAGGVLYKVITAIPNTEAWAGKASVLSTTVANDLNIPLKVYSKTINGVTYDLFLYGVIGVFAFNTGKIANNVPNNGVLISLSDFSSELSGKKFISSFQNVYATDTTNRFNCVSNSANVVTVGALSTGFSPRGCVPIVLY